MHRARRDRRSLAAAGLLGEIEVARALLLAGSGVYPGGCPVQYARDARR